MRGLGFLAEVVGLVLFTLEEPALEGCRLFLCGRTQDAFAIRLDLNEVDWDTASELARRAYQDIAPRKLAALVD